MKARRASGLLPLSSPSPAQEREDRLRRAWALLVGPLLQRRTRILSLRGSTVVLGCWQLAHIPSLRRAAEAAWPEVRERLIRATGLVLSELEVLPCDPPPPPPPPAPSRDALAEVLKRYRARK